MSHQQSLLVFDIYQRISLHSQSENVTDMLPGISKLHLRHSPSRVTFEGRAINIKFRIIRESKALNFSFVNKGDQRDSAFFPAAFSF